METLTISRLAQSFGLSRSTLLYYDKIGLLPPSGRTDSGYRYYTESDRLRLERICTFRQAGLSLEDIQSILASEDAPYAAVIERRLKEIGKEILDLKEKQRVLSSMLRSLVSGVHHPEIVDKNMWIEMLRAAGMDQDAMDCWHAEFERRAPEAHHEFLLSIGIPEEEARQIRIWSRKSGTTAQGGRREEF